MTAYLLVAVLLGLSYQRTLAKCTGDSSRLPDAECNAWQALFDATSGSMWARCSSLRNDPCSCKELDWDARFVTCVNDTADASIQHIEEISMYGNSMNGTLPVALKNLPELKSLSVLENTISGALGAFLCLMPKLEYIRVGGLNVYTAMTGGIPSCLFVKSGIKAIWLRNTQLGGAAPTKLASSLQVLGLEGNRLTGPLPSFSYSQLSECNLKSNPFSCPLPAEAVSKCEATCNDATIASTKAADSSWTCECASGPTSKGLCYTRWRCCADSNMTTCDDTVAWGDKAECKDYCDKKDSRPLATKSSATSNIKSDSSWSCECASSPTSKGICYTRWRCCSDSNMTACDDTAAWGDKAECIAHCDKKSSTTIVI